MSYTTITSRISSDPYFHPRNLRQTYDWHEIPVLFEDVAIDGLDISFGYRAIIEYDDECHHRVLRFEMREQWTVEQIRRGVSLTYRPLTGNIVDSALHVLCSHHFESALGQSEMRAEIEQDQRRRDEEFDLAAAE